MSVRRVPPTEQLQRCGQPRAKPDYGDAFQAAMPHAGSRSAEQWARAIFEEAPGAVRRFVHAGWRFGLFIKLADPGNPDQVFGAAVITREPEVVRLELSSRLLVGQLVVGRLPSAVRLTTLVGYRSPLGRILWTIAIPIHRLTASYLLRRATNSIAA